MFNEKDEISIERQIYELALNQDVPFTLSAMDRMVFRTTGLTNQDLVKSVLTEMVNRDELKTFGYYYIPKVLENAFEIVAK